MRITGQHTRAERRDRRRERVLKTVAVLPSLATLGNLLCGVGAIYLCMLSSLAAGADLDATTLSNQRLESFFPTYLAIAAYLIACSMVFDGLDGRLARFARKTSEFGGQLDSLCDVVSFGVAPAMLVLCIARPEDIAALSVWERMHWRAEWVMAATFVCCAALRLAKFNVENVQGESAHMGFRGLPTPAAAAVIMGLVIVHQGLLIDLESHAIARVVSLALPPTAMALGLLMVSRFAYPHIINAVLRGRRTFHQVVAIGIVGMVALVVQFQLTITLFALAYALSGPIVYLVRRARGKADAPDLDAATVEREWSENAETFADVDADESSDLDASNEADYEGDTRSAG